MAKISRQVGSTSNVLEIFIQDSSKTDGSGLTGLLYTSSGLAAYYKRNKGTASVSVTLASITTLGTFVSGGLKEVDSTNMPGVYEFHPPDTALASGADSVVFCLRGATNMVPVLLEIDLTAVNNQDGVRFGLTALPNVASGSAGAIITDGTGTAQISASSGRVMTQGGLKKNTAFTAFTFYMADSSNSPKTGLTITATRSIDGGAFGSCTNSATEISGGWYSINLSSADLNGNIIALQLAGTGAVTRDITIITTV